MTLKKAFSPFTIDWSKISLYLMLIAALTVIGLAYSRIWKQSAEIGRLEVKLQDREADLAEVRGELADMRDAPLEYLMLYRRATLARFERIEPRWDQIMEAAWRLSRKNGVEPDLTIGKMEHESFFNPQAIGPNGEFGLMQIYVPAWPQFDTAKGFDIEYNIDFATRIFAGCMKAAKGNIKEALRFYNGKGALPDGMIPYADRVLNTRSMKLKEAK